MSRKRFAFQAMLKLQAHEVTSKKAHQPVQSNVPGFRLKSMALAGIIMHFRIAAGFAQSSLKAASRLDGPHLVVP